MVGDARESERAQLMRVTHVVPSSRRPVIDHGPHRFPHALGPADLPELECKGLGLVGERGGVPVARHQLGQALQELLESKLFSTVEDQGRKARRQVRSKLRIRRVSLAAAE